MLFSNASYLFHYINTTGKQATAGGGTSTALTQTKAPLYEPLALSYDAASEQVLVAGLRAQTVKSASEAMQLFARTVMAASAGTGEW